MLVTNVRPENASLVYSLDLLNNRRAFWLLQIPGTLAFILFGFLLILWTDQLRTDLYQLYSHGLVVTLWGAFSLLLSATVTIGLHELVHGIFFWLYSRSRPLFGLRGGYAFAAAPGWFFPRRQYLIVALAPLVLLTVVGMLLLLIVPAGALGAILFGVTVNISGAVGDMWIALQVLRQRGQIMIEDTGDGINIFALP
jgi:hypothetical protein